MSREMIAIELRHLCEDVHYWMAHHTYDADEIAARFHHRMVVIHLFPNGNGRHARMIADLLLEKRLGAIRFTWGGNTLTEVNECRQQYIWSLQKADGGDIAPLLNFVRS